jgi:hypothetical protein
MRTASASATGGPPLDGAGPLLKVSPNARQSPVSGLKRIKGSVNQAVPLCQPDSVFLRRGSPISMPSTMRTTIAMVELVTNQAWPSSRSCVRRAHRKRSGNVGVATASSPVARLIAEPPAPCSFNCCAPASMAIPRALPSGS